jgi:hypothetical protein
MIIVMVLNFDGIAGNKPGRRLILLHIQPNFPNSLNPITPSRTNYTSGRKLTLIRNIHNFHLCPIKHYWFYINSLQLDRLGDLYLLLGLAMGWMGHY